MSIRVDRLFHSVLNLQDYVTEVREAYQAQVDINLNQLMKLFTVITTICLPLTLIAGWYGMNFPMPEYTSSIGYPMVIALRCGDSSLGDRLLPQEQLVLSALPWGMRLHFAKGRILKRKNLKFLHFPLVSWQRLCYTGKKVDRGAVDKGTPWRRHSLKLGKGDTAEAVFQAWRIDWACQIRVARLPLIRVEALSMITAGYQISKGCIDV